MSIVAEELFDVIDDRTRELLAFRERLGHGHRRGWLVRRALLLADLLGLTLAFGAAQWAYGLRMSHTGSLDGLGEIAAFIVSLPVWVVAAKLYGLYDKDEERTDHSTTDDFSGVFHLVTVCTFLLYTVTVETRWFAPQFGKLLLFWLLATMSVTCFRVSARAYCRRQINYLQNTIIVGAGEVGQDIARKLLKHPEYGVNLVGFVDADPLARASGLEHLTLLGGPEEISDLVTLLDVERVIVAFSNERHEDVLDIVRQVSALNVQVDIIPRLFDILGPSIGIHTIEGIPVVGLPPARLPWSSLVLKRLVDLFLAALGLFFLSPLFAVVAILIKRDSDGPVFYRHERVGRGGTPFGLYKFRTMRREACRGEAYGGAAAEEEFARLMSDPLRRLEFEASYKLQSDPRVTRVGRVLRRLSFDELPQLINVITGDMSLVGPRPLTSTEVERYYGKYAAALLEVPPGITGYWQINGRSDLSYGDRVRLDLAYVGGWSLSLDLVILARTLRTVVTGRAAY